MFIIMLTKMICWEAGPKMKAGNDTIDLSRSKFKFSVEAKILHTVTRTQNIFYYTRSIFSMSPNSRRVVGVQKHIFVSERGIAKELLKQRANVGSCMELLLLRVRGMKFP